MSDVRDYVDEWKKLAEGLDAEPDVEEPVNSQCGHEEEFVLPNGMKITRTWIGGDRQLHCDTSQMVHIQLIPLVPQPKPINPIWPILSIIFIAITVISAIAV